MPTKSMKNPRLRRKSWEADPEQAEAFRKAIAWRRTRIDELLTDIENLSQSLSIMREVSRPRRAGKEKKRG